MIEALKNILHVWYMVAVTALWLLVAFLPIELMILADRFLWHVAP